MSNSKAKGLKAINVLGYFKAKSTTIIPQPHSAKLYDELGGICKEALLYYSRHYPVIWVDVLREITKNPSKLTNDPEETPNRHKRRRYQPSTPVQCTEHSTGIVFFICHIDFHTSLPYSSIFHFIFALFFSPSLSSLSFTFERFSWISHRTFR
jgi:hypothetical protein